MHRSNLYFELSQRMSAKGSNSVSGDILRTLRSVDATLIVLCDGLGGGVSANLAAELAVSRIMELVKSGFSPRDAFARVAETIGQIRGSSSTYAAMTAVNIRPDGSAAIYSYEAPPVLWISRNRKVSIPPMTSETVGKAIIQYGSCFLERGEALMLMSDGITQAGLGSAYPKGLPSEELIELLEVRLREKFDPEDIVGFVHRQALGRWGSPSGDDCSVALATCRTASVLNVLTGPPADKRRDSEICEAFMKGTASRAICGGSTANMLARCTGRQIKPMEEDLSFVGNSHTPPRFCIDGIELVAEGAVTLSQTLNVLDLHDRRNEATNAVSQLLGLLYEADHINFLVGRAENNSGDNVLMRQLGVRQRLSVVKRLAEALEKMDKLVTVKLY